MEDDFCPVVEQGESEAAVGVFGRFKRRQDAGPAAVGVIRVPIGPDGAPLEEVSAGQKYWSRARGWVKVDVTDHTLSYEIPFSDPTGRAGLLADVTVMAHVQDAIAAARRGAAGVKAFLAPALQQIVVRASAGMEPVPAENPVAGLIAVRRQADARMRERVSGDVAGLPTWLSATVTAVHVRFDVATERHYAELVERSRAGEVIDAEGLNDIKQTTLALDIRALWRDSLLPFLRDPSTRAFEVAFANPTDDNIARAVDQVNGAEFALLGEGIELLRTMVEKDFVDKNDPMYQAIEKISGKLESVYLPSAANALSNSAPKAELEARTDSASGRELPDADFND